MSRYPIYPPHWPPSDKETEAAIGRFVIAWGMLETQIDEAIGDLLQVDHTLQSCIVANLGTKSKVEIFLSTYHTESELFPAQLLKDVEKLGGDTATAAGVYRVWVAHGAPFRLDLGEIEGTEGYDPRKKWIWVKTVARKGGVKGSMALLTPEAFDRKTESVKALIGRWHSVRTEIAKWHVELRYARSSTEEFDQPDTHRIEISDASGLD